MNAKTVDFFKRVWLKYVVGYEKPKNYWNSRWRLELEAEKWNEETIKKCFNKVSELMRVHKCHSVLDIGCGKAVLRELEGYVGLDFSLEALEKSGLTQFIYCDFREKVPLPDKSFDCVFLRYVLLHVPFGKIDHVVSEISRITRKCIILKETWSEQPSRLQPHCFLHNLPELFSKHFKGEIVFLS